jgi:hypothetical protein
VVKSSPGFIEWLAIISCIVLNAYDDSAAEVSEEHSVSGLFVAVMRKLGRDAFQS